MNDEYTPTTPMVRNGYAQAIDTDYRARGQSFDRWLAGVVEAAEAKGRREAGEEAAQIAETGIRLTGEVNWRPQGLVDLAATIREHFTHPTVTDRQRALTDLARNTQGTSDGPVPPVRRHTESGAHDADRT